jgi:putative membrane protein
MLHSYGDIGFFGMHMFWWIFWVVLLFGGVSFFEPVPRSQRRNRKSSALEILQKRYANGELTDVEYENKKMKLVRDITPSDFSKPSKA